jgi:hypothetical protein
MTLKLIIWSLTLSLINGLFAISSTATAKSNDRNGPNTGGLYYSLQNNPSYAPSKKYLEIVFFYDDGTMVVYNVQKDSLDEKAQINSFLQNLDRYKYTGRWGYYKLKADSIEATVFIHDESRMRTRIPEHWEMTVKNSGTILLSRKECKDCRKHYIEYQGTSELQFNPMLEYNFFSSSIKADSSQAWFRNKDWYKQAKY